MRFSQDKQSSKSLERDCWHDVWTPSKPRFFRFNSQTSSISSPTSSISPFCHPSWRNRDIRKARYLPGHVFIVQSKLPSCRRPRCYVSNPGYSIMNYSYKHHYSFITLPGQRKTTGLDRCLTFLLFYLCIFFFPLYFSITQSIWNLSAIPNVGRWKFSSRRVTIQMILEMFFLALLVTSSEHVLKDHCSFISERRYNYLFCTELMRVHVLVQNY